MNCINSSLITLKCVLFLIFGAIGTLFPFLPLHMNDHIGLSKDESIIVSVVAPLIALIGPLIAAPLADRLAGGFGGTPRSKSGFYLRVMIALCLILATIFYWLLYFVPPIIRSPPSVSFACDQQGGFILQDRCGAERTCYNWGSTKGSVLVRRCQFSCNASTTYSGDYTTMLPEEEETTEAIEYYDGSIIPVEAEPLVYGTPDLNEERPVLEQQVFVPYPHMCYKNESGNEICEVHTEYTRMIEFKIGLRPSITSEDDEVETCKYPFADYFYCRITPSVAENLTSANQRDCHPVVVCEIHNPYNNQNSLLKRSQCGYDNISFWLYLFIRSFADIFPAAAATLVATAVVIATRETSAGRGDVGKQFAAGVLGFGIFSVIIGATQSEYLYAMIRFTVLMAIAAIILLADFKMPLSPPEWWWHTRCGLLALPMSSVRNYGLETAALGIVLFFLGIFWNSIDTFLPWHIAEVTGNYSSIGAKITVASLPAFLVLIFAERVVDYCGHSNILIFCFVNYILRHLALTVTKNVVYIILCQCMEIFTLYIMYITAVLYLRHLVPRKFTACGQALPIIAHFCLGRCFGALFGGMAYSEYPDNFQAVHRGFAIAAAVVAIIYFFAYHFYMKPKCAAPLHLPPDPAPTIFQNMNENGSYTPLRVYHNSKSKKGHFRY